MNNNTKGVIVFFVLTLMLSMVITFPVMIGREIYQYKHYLKPHNIGFEWDDIFTYGFIIILAEILQVMLLIIFNII